MDGLRSEQAELAKPMTMGPLQKLLAKHLQGLGLRGLGLRVCQQLLRSDCLLPVTIYLAESHHP